MGVIDAVEAPAGQPRIVDLVKIFRSYKRVT